MISFIANNIDVKSLPPSMAKYFPGLNEKCGEENKNADTPEAIYSSFQLPIHYLEKTNVHTLSPTVSSDLELVTCNNADGKPMYDFLFKPKHDFARQMIPEWSKQYTSNIPFLTDSQSVVLDTGKYLDGMSKCSLKEVDCEKVMTVWKSVKEDPLFLEKYCYMEWEILKYLNHSSSFLQCLSIINLMSPLTSILVPILFLIFPFIILKIQRLPIDFNTYLDVLKTIAKNHFIGKTLASVGNVSPTNIAYVVMTIGFYFLQIYQNIISFMRFYRNIRKINDHLYDMKEYVGYSIQSMETFVNVHSSKASYSGFCNKTREHCENLKKLYADLEGIYPFRLSISKFNHIGYMLKCYHELYVNPEYEKSLRYSIGFEGYVNNVIGVYENIYNKKISIAVFDVEKECDIEEQYYPPYVDIDHVKNDCHLDKNMIITGVNASGKTTMLKATTINIIFTQQLGCGFYKKLSIRPYTHIHSYLNIPDTSGRDSLFQAESRRCKEIIDIIGKNKNDSENRHFCIFDELYSGTNPVEATKSAYAFLLYLSEFKNVDFILTTHYTSICKKVKSACKRIRNYKMDVSKDEDDNLVYTYKIKPGICNIEGAIEILKTMEYPSEILENIQKYDTPVENEAEKKE